MAPDRTYLFVLASIVAVFSSVGYKYKDCLPQPSDGLVFYAETSTTKWQLISEETLERSSLPNCSTLYVIIHGYSESSTRPWIQRLSTALLQSDPRACNIIVDHWNYFSLSRSYMTENLKKIAEDLAQFLQIVSTKCDIKFSSMHAIAFSIAGQIIGGVPVYLQKNQTLGRITGLDNSLPWKETDDKNVFLDDSDADVVVSLRTSRYGVSNPDFDVDFYFNNFDGVQTACDNWWWPDFVGQICSHYRAIDLLIEIILSESSVKPGCRCKGNVMEEDCDLSDMNLFGENVNSQNKGIFCLNTNDHPPYLKQLK